GRDERRLLPPVHPPDLPFVCPHDSIPAAVRQRKLSRPVVFSRRLVYNKTSASVYAGRTAPRAHDRGRRAARPSYSGAALRRPALRTAPPSLPTPTGPRTSPRTPASDACLAGVWMVAA